MMKAALMGLVLASCAHSPAPLTDKPFPAEGRCIAVRTADRAPCVHVSLAEAHTIQQVLASYAPARKLALEPITRSTIGAFWLAGDRFPGFAGDVLRAEAVERQEGADTYGYRVFVGRDAAGWHMLRAHPFEQTEDEEQGAE